MDFLVSFLSDFYLEKKEKGVLHLGHYVSIEEESMACSTDFDTNKIEQNLPQDLLILKLRIQILRSSLF